MLKGPTMTKPAKTLLSALLCILGGGALFAVVAVFMPMSWMVAIHRWLGLGEMPTDPIVEYLARSVSAFYVFIGALCLVVASDLERYLPLARFLGLGFFVTGVVFTGVDVVTGMPWWWSAFEGPPGILLGPWIYYLAQNNCETHTDFGVKVQSSNLDT
jgi:hypothetical protein